MQPNQQRGQAAAKQGSGQSSQNRPVKPAGGLAQDDRRLRPGRRQNSRTWLKLPGLKGAQTGIRSGTELGFFVQFSCLSFHRLDYA